MFVGEQWAACLALAVSRVFFTFRAAREKSSAIQIKADQKMAAVRYDLTPKVEPFLDSELFAKIVEFNGGAAAAPSGTAPAASAEPSLATAQQLYKAGKYAEASELLGQLKAKANPASDEYETIVWGKLASDLLAYPEAPKADTTKTETPKPEEGAEGAEGETAATESGEKSEQKLEASKEDVVLQSLQGVHDLLDQRRSSDSTVQLNRRAWLIHWSLFAYFNGRLPKLVETFFTSQYMSVIHAACPWILRYVVVAVVSTHPRSVRFNRRVKDLTRVVQQELYEYNDAVVDFVKTLYIDYNFSEVASKLEVASEQLKNDFFAHSDVSEFVSNARFLIADAFLRVHEHVPLASLANAVGLSGAEAKEFASKYVQAKQDAKLDAVYDETKDTVRVSYAKPSIYTQVADKVKNIDQRANQIQHQQNSEKK